MTDTAYGDLCNPSHIVSSNSIISPVLDLAKEHAETWRDQPERYWAYRLVLEVIELVFSLLGQHEHPPELELQEIASICLNWLDMRKERNGFD